ncbi:MAG: cbb3-type cytochrome oxidase assembly protein CcoS [Kiloniellales bacterium]|nr:cbb3-type cytochrome oxidase assembly protein CcoS [Kiloniellales bacterium]
MSILVYLLPAALFLGLLALAAFLWSIRSGQYDDLDGAAQRILFDDPEAARPPDQLPPDRPPPDRTPDPRPQRQGGPAERHKA